MKQIRQIVISMLKVVVARRRICWILAIIIVFVAGAVLIVPRDRDSGDVVVWVNDRVIHRPYFERMLNRRAVGSDGIGAKNLVLQELIERQALLDLAEKRGLLDDPSLQIRLENTILSELRQHEIFESGVAEKVTSDAEIEAYYEQVKDIRYRRSAKLRYAVIKKSCDSKMSDEKRGQLRALLESIRAQSTDATAFRARVMEFSDDQATRYQKGDCGWIKLDEASCRFGSVVAEALAELATSDSFVSEVVETTDGYFLFAKLAYEPATNISLDLLRRNIKNELQQGYQADVLSDMTSNAVLKVRVRVNHDILDSIDFKPVSSSGCLEPPGLAK